MGIVVQVTVLLTLLLLSCPAQFAGGQGVVCESNGHCEVTSGACENDKVAECSHIRSKGGIYATYEDLDGATKPITLLSPKNSCEQKWTAFSSTGLANLTLESLELDHVYENPMYVGVCASWNLTSNSGHNGGFSVNILNRRQRVRYRVCVLNALARRLCFYLRYDKLFNFNHFVRVYPFPYSTDTDISVISKTKEVQSNLVGCADVEHNTSTCYRHYNRPENVTVTSCIHEDGKDLRITWEPPSGAKVLPETYYLALYFPGNVQRMYFRVNNSLQLTVRNLSASFNYSIEVQAYRRCVGLGDYYVAPHRLGCGEIAPYVDEILSECVEPTTSTLSSSTVIVLDTLALPRKENLFAGARLYGTIVGTIGGITVLVITCVIMLIAVIKVFSRCFLRGGSCSDVHPKSVPKVFVFYTPGVTESRVKTIQEQITCVLLKHFDVVTPNNISSGNISIWLEETVKSVDSVLLVGNKEFFCDWNKSKEERPPVMNSLELIISAAAAQDSISRYAFISAEKSIQDVFIPDNSYLKVMLVFLLPDDIKKLYQFVTKSRGIELRTDTPH